MGQATGWAATWPVPCCPPVREWQTGGTWTGQESRLEEDQGVQDFLRCVTAALIYFAISITAVAKYPDGASKAAGVFGFFATIVFAIDFYLIFNDVAKFLKQEDSAHETTADKAEEENSDSDSD
uniref:Uncharacterized protein n=1 Tax=Ovis aries TaxID=9940 RepID=A0AC11E265_SHEEP